MSTTNDRNQYYREYRIKNREKRLLSETKYRDKNRQQLNEKRRSKPKTAEQKEAHRLRMIEYRKEYPEKVKEAIKKYITKNGTAPASCAARRKEIDHVKYAEAERRYNRKKVDNLHDSYIIKGLSQKTGSTYAELKNEKELIELQRQILKIKRYAKQGKN